MFNLLTKQYHSIKDLIANTSWLISTELVAKVSRIFTIVVLAAKLSPTAYGTAMLALALHDLFGMLLRAGVGSQVINCKAENLKAYCANGTIIQWLICLIIIATQYGSAELIASLYDNADLAMLLKVMVVIYLFYPWVCIRIFLLQRENNMRWFSIRSSSCIIIENTTVAVSALMGADIFSVALGKIAFSILWLILFSFSPVTTFRAPFNLAIFVDMVKTSSKLFNSELLKTTKTHADTFIAGKLLSPEMFGLYTFAKNAGAGLSQSISQVYISALFPYLSECHRQKTFNNKESLILLVSIAFGFMFVLQALLVPIYVPILFPEQWSTAIPVITILCLMALPNFITDIFCCVQRVKAHYHSESLIRFFSLTSTLFALLIVIPTTPIDFAVVMLVSTMVSTLLIYIARLIQKPNLILLKQ